MKCWIWIVTVCCAIGLYGQTLHERYTVGFYGIPLPTTGARVLVIADRSKSMLTRDIGRTDGASRWTTLVDNLSQMVSQMEALIEAKRVPFSVVMLYEGGGEHAGSACFDIAKRGQSEALISEVKAQFPGAGGNFLNTFDKHLWRLVAQHHITHIFFLGDTDIDRQGEEVRRAVTKWYDLPPIQKKQQATFHTMNPAVFPTTETDLLKLKQQWWEPWGERIRLRTFNRRGVPYPPPQENPIFNCITIGRQSYTQEHLATLGKGQCIQVSVKKAKQK